MSDRYPPCALRLDMVNLGARGLPDRTVAPIIESQLYALGPVPTHNKTLWYSEAHERGGPQKCKPLPIYK